MPSAPEDGASISTAADAPDAPVFNPDVVRLVVWTHTHPQKTKKRSGKTRTAEGVDGGRLTGGLAAHTAPVPRHHVGCFMGRCRVL